MASTLLDHTIKKSFCLSLGDFCTEIQTVLSPNAFQRHNVISISHYKERTSVGHEFLVLKVHDSENTRLLDLRLERRPSARKLGIPCLRANFSYVRHALDTIHRDEPSFTVDDYHCILTARFHRDQHFSILKICEIYTKIRDMGPRYSLTDKQCYWFCRMFVELVKRDYRVKIARGKGYDLAGQYGPKVAITSVDGVRKEINDYEKSIREKQAREVNNDRKRQETAVQRAVETRRRERTDMDTTTRVALDPFLRTPETVRKEEEQRLKLLFTDGMKCHAVAA